MTGQEARDDERESARPEPWVEAVNRALWHYDMGLLDVHGVAETLAQKRPEPEITNAFRAYVDRLGVDANEEHDGDEWWSGYRQAQRDNILRATAALRVPVGEGLN